MRRHCSAKKTAAKCGWSIRIEVKSPKKVVVLEECAAHTHPLEKRGSSVKLAPKSTGSGKRRERSAAVEPEKAEIVKLHRDRKSTSLLVSFEVCHPLAFGLTSIARLEGLCCSRAAVHAFPLPSNSCKTRARFQLRSSRSSAFPFSFLFPLHLDMSGQAPTPLLILCSHRAFGRQHRYTIIILWSTITRQRPSSLLASTVLGDRHAPTLFEQAHPRGQQSGRRLCPRLRSDRESQPCFLDEDGGGGFGRSDGVAQRRRSDEASAPGIESVEEEIGRGQIRVNQLQVPCYYCHVRRNDAS